MRSPSKPQPKESPKISRNRVINRERPTMHAMARPCHLAQPGRATFLAGRAGLFLGARPCSLLHAHALTCFSSALLFLVLGASSNLYTSLKFSQNAIFADKTRRFSQKRQISHNISIFESKEANLSLSHVDLAWKQGETGITPPHLTFARPRAKLKIKKKTKLQT